MAEMQTFSVSDLLSFSRPVTVSASMAPSPCSPSLKRHKPCSPPVAPTNALFDKIRGPELSFAPINPPVLLVGTVDLPIESYDQLFSFSDCSACVSCAIVGFDLKVIGCRIHVLAWNFIPFKKRSGGLLEISQWCYLPALSPPKAVKFCNKKGIVGVLRAVSPVFTAPCRNELLGSDSIGFLVELITCNCIPCSDSSSAVSPLKHSSNCMYAPEFVYFLRPSCKWWVALVKLIGEVVTVSGLEKTQIFVGEKASYVMFVTSLETRISPSLLPPDFMQQGGKYRTELLEETDYVGLVTGIYMNGMAVELDDKVWLLVSDPNLVPEISLRVGAVISVRNFELVHPEFSWIQIDMLVCSCRTNINIMAFSVSDTRTYLKSLCQSLLVKFFLSLKPTAKFWVLLLISCFKRKFANILSEKEIFGTRNNEGLLHAYARSNLPAHFIQSQNGIFMDFCKHEQPVVNHEHNLPTLKLVVPISYLISKCEVTWVSILKKMQFHDEELVTKESMVTSPCKGTTVIRKIISSDDLGCILMGHFKCTSSRKLQLVDATGSVDVVVPDILSSFHCQGIHEIKKFEVVIEGPSMQLELLQLPCTEPLSCKNIFGLPTLKKISNQLTVYVHFYLEDSICHNAPINLPLCMSRSCNNVARGTTHLFRVTHKFPAAQSHMFDSVASLASSLWAEALLLPYDAIFTDDVNCGPSAAAEFGTVFPFFGISTSSNPYIPNSTGYLCYKGGTVLANGPSRFRPILLEFFTDDFMKYQSLKLGGYYIMRCSKNCPLCSKKSRTKISLSSQTILWKVSFSFAPIASRGERQRCTSEDYVVGDYQVLFGNTCRNGLLFQPSSKKLRAISDVHLVVSYHRLGAFDQGKAMEEVLFNHLSTTREVLSVSSTIKIMKSKLLTLRSLRCAGTLTQRCLRCSTFITVQGIIESMHRCKFAYRSHLSGEDTLHYDSSHSSICLHVYDSRNMIRIHGKLHKNDFPIGMAPGATVTIHRIFLKCSAIVFPKLILTSTSFVEINCVKERIPTSLSEFGKSKERLQFSTFYFISKLRRYMITGLVRFRCRLARIHFLVLEKADIDYGRSEPSRQLRMPSIKVPLMGFVLGDGSFVCCCWADAERAELLLRLDEVLNLSFSDSESVTCHDTIGHHLAMLLNKYHKIIARNKKSVGRSGPMNFTFYVDSGEKLSDADEMLLRYILNKARHGPTLDIIGCMMDSYPLDLYDEGDSPKNAMQLPNIWATDILEINPMEEGWNLLDEVSRYDFGFNDEDAIRVCLAHHLYR